MTRPRKPSNVLEMSGAFDKNPSRRRARSGEPKNLAALGPVPKHLGSNEQGAWKEVIKNAPKGVLKRPDRHIVELAAKLIVRIREGAQVMRDANGDQVFNQRTGEPIIINVGDVKDYARLETILGKLGMTPSDRSKVVGDDHGPKSGFEDLV